VLQHARYAVPHITCQNAISTYQRLYNRKETLSISKDGVSIASDPIPPVNAVRLNDALSAAKNIIRQYTIPTISTLQKTPRIQNQEMKLRNLQDNHNLKLPLNDIQMYVLIRPEKHHRHED